ncbi:MAG TPA: hypothetical protein VN728_07540 [Stellaceae bacterium]|jgi:hypothetical protein|nr:hypothetical protein [Stellaceae bacterium]
MRYVVDAPNGKSWFRLETEGEAAQESQLMRHNVEKYFRIEREKAVQSYQPVSKSFIEQDIGLNAHIQRAMPLFLTLRDQDGKALVTAMLPPGGKTDAGASCIIVGPGNADPYPTEGDAIKALGAHFGLTLERERCYPYRRG